LRWIEVPYGKLPKPLKQLCDVKYFRILKLTLDPPDKLGGSYAFATDDEGNIWFIELGPFGDDRRCLKMEVEEE
jgi:hypothetical protein